ncbi:hypothetical protein KDD17_05995 [Sulfitobacter albidus]|uniref:Uncharacterized protein n=1 Tax=Sulfitobacter albidus TaxID=2829501 RepID=A0A975JHC8_9RHOB|nr:hypothetical protein KDD17_05995 [Sulfitobacter albidus]
MRARGWILAAVIGGLAPQAVAEQDAPLSVIDWLDAPQPLASLPRAPQVAAPAPVDEPAVAATGTAPAITTRPLSDSAPLTVGLVPAAVTGMRPDLWQGSKPREAGRAIRDLPTSDLPAANALLYTLLLAEAATPPDISVPLTRARVGKLMALGAVDPALSLIEQAGGPRDPALFDLWADLTLLIGTEDRACGALSRNPQLSRDIGLRIFCDARGGNWADAALTFGSARALGLMPRETLEVFDRFLNPDVFEDAAPLPAPRKMTPLTFRLFETIGEPLPTRPLPRPYAVADLRDISGWKSQLEAAERLTRAGALPDNRLLGLYTNRKPAASGGIWDRVRAVQRFDAALDAEAQAVARHLPPAWEAMRAAGLEVSFSAAFHDRLAPLALSGKAAEVQQLMGLLSPAYEDVARAIPPGGPLDLARAVAGGEVPARAPDEALPRAIHDGFGAPVPMPAAMALAQDGRLGEALLMTLRELYDGQRGDSRALRRAISTLRALGLEDTARRAALQILLRTEPE